MRQIDVAWNYPNNCILSRGYKMATKNGSSGVMVGENHPQPQYLC